MNAGTAGQKRITQVVAILLKRETGNRQVFLPCAATSTAGRFHLPDKQSKSRLYCKEQHHEGQYACKEFHFAKIL